MQMSDKQLGDAIVKYKIDLDEDKFFTEFDPNLSQKTKKSEIEDDDKPEEIKRQGSSKSPSKKSAVGSPQKKPVKSLTKKKSKKQDKPKMKSKKQTAQKVASYVPKTLVEEIKE